MERVRAYQGTAAYQKALGKRKVWVEPLFGEAKQWHGLGRFRLRGLEKVNSESLLIAAGQNLKRFLSEVGLGPPAGTQWGSNGGRGLFLWPEVPGMIGLGISQVEDTITNAA